VDIELNLAGALVPDLIGFATLRYPDKVAVDVDGDTLTFAELSDRASRLAGALRDRGLGEGRRVALLALNEREYLEIRVGAQRAGVILVPLNYRLAESELAACLEDCEPDLLIVGPEFEEQARRMPVPALLRIGAPPEAGAESYEAALAGADPLPVPAGHPPERICHISYTSGTTARPKGVMLSNRSIHHGTMAMGHELGSHPQAVFLASTPLFHVGSQVGYSCVYLGGTHVQMRKFDPEGFLATLDRTRATHCQLVPAMIQMIVDRWGDRPTSTLQRILYGAAPMPPALLRSAIDKLGCEFVNGYGSTESMGVSFLTPYEHDPERAPELLASVGRSSALSTSRVVDENDAEVAPGEIGEVLARGPAVMSGYWRNPEATAEALRGDWMHTGDLGYRDEQGYLYLVDRRNDKIVTGGENVFPSEVENVILAHPDVAEVAVIGVPDRTWGEAVSAVVVLRPGTAPSAQDIVAHCRASLAGYKVPKHIRFDDAPLPRTPTGKLLRRDLRRAWQEPAGA
jgi:long-chain acyl-CoA synthetase